jgi:organic radical activating enzyme
MSCNYKNPFGSKTYCTKAFTNIFTDGANRYRLCADAGITPEIKDMNIETTFPLDFYYSEGMDKVREKMLKGEYIKGCEVCYEQETKTGWSYRQDHMRKIDDYGLKEFPTTPLKPGIKLRTIGTKCNLGCFMCRAYDSSTRRMELSQTNLWDLWRDLGMPEYENARVRNISFNRNKELLKHLKENETGIHMFRMCGGEPLISDRMWEMCNQVSDEYAKEMGLFITTNLTTLDYKGNTLHDLAKKFKYLQLEVSCDHFGDKLKWIRYPIDVDTFEENLYRMKPYIDSIVCTVSILNAFDMKDIEEYYMDNFGINVRWYALYSPSSLSIKNLPNKDDIPYIPTDEIKGELMKECVPSELEKGYDYVRRLEKHRGMKILL